MDYLGQDKDSVIVDQARVGDRIVANVAGPIRVA